MARKRMRMRRDANVSNGKTQGHYDQTNVTIDGKVIGIRQLISSDEGILYSMKITDRPIQSRPRSHFSTLKKNFTTPTQDEINQDIEMSKKFADGGDLNSPVPQSNTIRANRSTFGNDTKQYTISKVKKYKNPFLNFVDAHQSWDPFKILAPSDVDSHLYKPSTFLFRYINWTFYASFSAVFSTFMVIFMFLCFIFGGFLKLAGDAQPECIVVSGEHYGTNDATRLSDAFALSWTTFTTVGYGMTYTTTGNDFDSSNPRDCSVIVFLCTLESFLGLIYAGMCAAILFGKVNRIQSHANLAFCNAICLQYEEVDPETDDEDDDDDESTSEEETMESVSEEVDEENQFEEKKVDHEVIIHKEPDPNTPTKKMPFVEQFNGCPVLKFQVVNELCNKEGGEIVDAIMKVIGIKFKARDGKVTCSQYVRVNLVDFEHPFFSRVWHGVHILDASSPLLTDKARRKIKKNGGSWPSDWFDPDVIRSKLEFNDLVVTVAGISNVSASTVHAYKRYKIGDVLIGFDFAPLVYRNERTEKLEVDLSLVHDVREQQGGGGEELRKNMTRAMSTIRIKDASLSAKGSSEIFINPSMDSNGHSCSGV